MANNLATVDKIFRTPLTSAEAAVDAMMFLLRSPELPEPTRISESEFAGRPCVILNWQDAERHGWIRAWFVGDGISRWIACGPPHDCIDDDANTFAPVEDGAPQAMVDYIKFLMLEAA